MNEGAEAGNRLASYVHNGPILQLFAACKIFCSVFPNDATTRRFYAVEADFQQLLCVFLLRFYIVNVL